MVTTTQSAKEIDRSPQTNNTDEKSSKNYLQPRLGKYESNPSQRNTRNTQKVGLKPTTTIQIAIRTETKTSEKRTMNEKKCAHPVLETKPTYVKKVQRNKNKTN